MRTDDFDYVLPEELIAQTPLPRGESRLMVLRRESGQAEHRSFSALRDYLRAGDTLVLNDSRVTARRLFALREAGGAAEVLLLRPRGETEWEALVRPGKRLRAGASLRFSLSEGEDIVGEIVASTPEGGRILRFEDATTRDRLKTAGAVPLPPYIRTRLEDEERYQTVYSGPGGSAAAPTAGLHFTPEMLRAIEAAGVRIARVTLHIGVDTFRPVKTERLEDHAMHGERFTLSSEEAARINSTPGRVIAVGTTVVRVLESAAVAPGCVAPMAGETRLFITPGYRFQTIQGLLTNFHLPRSTLLMLVSALAGRETVLAAYQAAVEAQYRFFSFGDAMLVI
jgi:S-adenosylmethionine:tRNA ribosyltransferase-isomerase